MQAMLASLFLLIVVTAFSGHPVNTLTQVDSKKVCMVNDKYFGSDQIPVSVGSKTYFGCCENCKKTLKEKKSSRVGTDPITNKQVDKSTAIIGAVPNGKVHYFETLANLNAYKNKLIEKQTMGGQK